MENTKKKEEKKVVEKSKEIKKEEIKKEEKSKEIKKEKKSKTVSTVARDYFCRSSGDPHFATFSGELYNFYEIGDWTLVKSHHFRVDARTKKMEFSFS